MNKTDPFDALKTTHGDGGEAGFTRRQQAWPAIAQWLRQITEAEESESVQPSLLALMEAPGDGRP